MIEAKDIMKKNVITVEPNDPVEKVIKVLLDNDISSTLVKDSEGRLVGMITEYDLILAVITVGHGFDVANIMNRDFVKAEKETSLEEIAEVFITNRIKSLPVVDEKGELVGILSRKDILKYLYAEA